MPYTHGATIDYPFDAYESYFEILANKNKERLHKIPVSLTFLGNFNLSNSAPPSGSRQTTCTKNCDRDLYTPVAVDDRVQSVYCVDYVDVEYYDWDYCDSCD